MKDFIKWEEIDLKGKTSGQCKTKCPRCVVSQRSNPNSPDLSVNISKGLAKCWYCEAVSVRDTEENNVNDVEYKLPVQTWRNYTTLSEGMVKWFEGRKISQSTLINCGVTEERYYQPALKKEVTNVVFNYFIGETVVNKKYRSSNKKFTQSAGTKNIFYGLNDIIGEKEVYLVEGEMDKLAMYEAGIKNCISVPNGANDNDDVWQNSKNYLEGVEKFYIAVDCDSKGNELSDKVSQRLGKYRCLRVTFKNKDANEDLVEGIDVLLNSIKSAKRYPVNGTFTSRDLEGKMIDLYNNGLPETIYPKHRSFGDLKKVFSVMRGHLVTGTGIPSHGKSAFTEWYVMNLVNDYNMKASFFSPEHSPMELHQSTFAQKYWAKNYFSQPRISLEELETYIGWADEKIYLTTPDHGEFPTWNWLFEKFKEQIYSFGIDIFVIDAFNKLSFNGNGNRLDQISEVLSKLTAFAQMNDVIIFLIAHPTKMQKNDQGVYNMATLYDVSGSADFRNQTHDGYCIYRHFGNDQGAPDYSEFVNLKTKFSFQGEITGKVAFEYHLPSGRFYERFTEPDTRPLHDFNKVYEDKPEEKPLPVVNPDDAFGDEEFMNNDSVPF